MSSPRPESRPAAWRFRAALTTACLLALLAAAGLIASRPAGASDPRPARPMQAGAGSSAIYLPLGLRSAKPEPLRLERSTIFGVQISELRFRQEDMLVGVEGAGASIWRTFLFWDEVEPEQHSPPRYDWAHYDMLFGRAQRLGMTVIAEIQGNPRWAADFPGGPPHDVDDLARFVAAAVERYDGDGQDDAPGGIRVPYWELYNEPDNADPEVALEGRGWGFWGEKGDEYARMLKRVYPVIKLADPSATVLLGGLAHERFEDGGPFNIEFLDDVLAAGGGPYFDVMNFHYYPAFAPAWAEHGIGVIGKATGIARKLSAYGLEKPMMVTEAGMWSDAEPPYPPATPADQVRYVAKLYARALAAQIQAVIWFQYDDVYGVADPARGLVDGDLKAKPSRTAYRVASSQLAGARPERPARDLGAAGEVYWFRAGQERLAVAWTEDGSRAELALRAPEVLWVTALGESRWVRDESDGQADGIVRLPYGADPVFIRMRLP